MTRRKAMRPRRYMTSLAHTLRLHSKRLIQSALKRLGYRIVRLTEEELAYLTLSETETGAPLRQLQQTLNPSNPRLRELRERYSHVQLPLAQRTTWDDAYVTHELHLRFFRADNPYVWQFLNFRENLRRKYYLLGRYVAERDPLDLLHKLGEDGAFGCRTFAYDSLPCISRDLIDSVNELYFLDRQFGLFSRNSISILDIGAGYGRLAHRMSTAVSGLERYCCVDAVPESTFLCEFYVDYRKCTQKVSVVPLDELDRGVRGKRFDLAINIHSFSEMGYAAIEGWLRLAADLDIPCLFIVPNESDQLLSTESDKSRRDFQPLLQSLGYRLKSKEPVLLDPDIRELVCIQDHFFFFERD